MLLACMYLNYSTFDQDMRLGPKYSFVTFFYSPYSHRRQDVLASGAPSVETFSDSEMLRNFLERVSGPNLCLLHRTGP